MIDPRQIEQLAQEWAQRLTQFLPPGLKGFRQELETNFRALLQNGLEKLDLVSREQFETQRELLARSREKLEQLEQRIKELEAELERSDRR
ncbi:MAG TPA: accessory factor UbiK family protein [Nevskiales bacterium]|nr:accessory factor UbiK family protein [Nevskiales bacterium]